MTEYLLWLALLSIAVAVLVTLWRITMNVLTEIDDDISNPGGRFE